MINKNILKQTNKVINQLGLHIRQGKRASILGNDIMHLTSLEIYITENYGTFPTDDGISYAMHDISKVSCQEQPKDRRRKVHYIDTQIIYDVLYMDFHRGLAVLKLQKMLDQKDYNQKRVSAILDKLEKLENSLDAYASYDIVFYSGLVSSNQLTTHEMKDIIHYIITKQATSDKNIRKIA